MQYKPSDQICVFESQESGKCFRLQHENYKYCLQHLKYLTHSNVKTVVSNIIIEVLGVAVEEINESAHIMEDLGADSLDIPALLIDLEEAFEIEIPDDVVLSDMLSVGGSIKYITAQLLNSEKYLTNINIDFAELHRKSQSKEETVNRALKQILEKPLFQDYFNSLSLKKEKLEELFRMIMRNNQIYHVTTVPEFADSRLDFVYIFFLSKARIYLFKLQHKNLNFQSAPLNELKLSYKILFGDGDEISQVIVSSRSQGVQSSSRRSDEESI